MASSDANGKREPTKLPPLPDHLVNFVDFKREMVRLDYTAEQLRRACREVEERRVKTRERLKREADQVAAKAHACRQRQLRDDQETLDLQKQSRQVAEQKRILQAEIQTSQIMYQELVRKRAKLQHWLDDLEEHRNFLSQIIAHKVSPRTPTSARQRPSTSRIEEDKIVEVMQNPGMIRSRLANKERNVIAQSRMVFQACQLMDRCCLSNGDRSSVRVDCDKPEQMTTSTIPAVINVKGGGMQSGLGDQIFATVHRLYKQFIAPQSSSCDALANFAALERYAYYVLQMVDACDPAMLKKIIAKVVIDKKKTLEQQKIQRDAEHRAERERKAQANATSAPAHFKRVTVVNRNRLRASVRYPALGNKKPKSESREEVEAAPTDEYLYLFRLQM